MRGSLRKKKEHDRDTLPGSRRVQNYKQRGRNDKTHDQLSQRNSKQPLCISKYQDKEEGSGKSVMIKGERHVHDHPFIHLFIHSCMMRACFSYLFRTDHGRWSGQVRRLTAEGTLWERRTRMQIQTGSSRFRVYTKLFPSNFFFFSKMFNSGSFILRK